MTEILTESFCERCGTRYTFESVAPRQRRLGGIRVLGRGLKNFVLSDDASLDEAMAAARSDSEREATARQLDAFHRTFNFCMSCRQYTCGNCWNTADGRCLSCAPLAIAPAAEAPFEAPDADRLLRFLAPPEDAAAAPTSMEHEHEPQTTDGVGVSGSDAQLEVERAAEEAVSPTGEVEAGVEPEVEPEIEAGVEAGIEAEHARPGLLGLAPGESLDEAIAAYEASVSAAPPTPIAAPPEPVAAEPEAVAAPPEPVAAEPEAVAAAESRPTAEPQPAAVAEPEREVGVAPSPPSRRGASLETPTEAPHWPTGPRWPTGVPARPAPTATPAPVDALAAIMARKATEAMWAASSQDVIQPPFVAPAAPSAQAAGVQPCISCGISLSANARFCRRCGTSQSR